MPIYSIHIQFADGSNPYVRYNMRPSQFAEEKAKWEERYILVELSNTIGKNIMFYKAFRKENADHGDQGSTF